MSIEDQNPRRGLFRRAAGARGTGVGIVVLIGILSSIYGQTVPVASPTATPASSVAPTELSAPVAIPLAEVVGQASAVSSRIQNMGDENASDPIATSVNDQLPLLLKDIDARSAETAKILESRPSLDTLRSLDTEWLSTGGNLAGWKRQLTARATELDRFVVGLTQLSGTWNATLQEAEKGPALQPNQARTASAPREIITLIQATIAAIKQAGESFEKRRSQILSLQNRVAEQEARITSARSSIERARQETVNRLFVKDSPPIWSGQLRQQTRERLLQNSQASLAEQLNGVATYARQEVPQFFTQGFIAMLLIGCLYWARRRVQPWLADEPALVPVALIFDLPVATALVFTILISGWIHPQAPRLFSVFVGAAALVPTVVILRLLVEHRLQCISSALVVFYFVDLLRGIAITLPLLARFLLLAELLGGIAFMVWLVSSGRLSVAGQV
ncbi:MAG: hypothetical protein M3Y27_10280, partial [Acidobacteriota bacterium]|nr:hypothetical protein [Acidobacteriota bacterium]